MADLIAAIEWLILEMAFAHSSLYRDVETLDWQDDNAPTRLFPLAAGSPLVHRDVEKLDRQDDNASARPLPGLSSSDLSTSGITL